MNSIHRSPIASLALGLLVLCTAACGGKDEPAGTAEAPAPATAAPEAEPPSPAAPEAAEPATGKADEIRYSGVTSAGEKFLAQIGGDIKLPKSLPSDFPLYPNAVPYASMELTDTTLVSFDSWDPASSVYQFYSEKLPEAGWKIGDEINMGGQRLLKISKDGRPAELRIESTNDGSRISFLLQPPG